MRCLYLKGVVVNAERRLPERPPAGGVDRCALGGELGAGPQQRDELAVVASAGDQSAEHAEQGERRDAEVVRPPCPQPGLVQQRLADVEDDRGQRASSTSSARWSETASSGWFHRTHRRELAGGQDVVQLDPRVPRPCRRAALRSWAWRSRPHFAEPVASWTRLSRPASSRQRIEFPGM